MTKEQIKECRIRAAMEELRSRWDYVDKLPALKYLIELNVSLPIANIAYNRVYRDGE